MLEIFLSKDDIGSAHCCGGHSEGDVVEDLSLVEGEVMGLTVGLIVEDLVRLVEHHPCGGRYHGKFCIGGGRHHGRFHICERRCCGIWAHYWRYDQAGVALSWCREILWEVLLWKDVLVKWEAGGGRHVRRFCIYGGRCYETHGQLVKVNLVHGLRELL